MHDFRDAPVFVAGHNGLVGGAIMRNMATKGYRDVLTRSRAELDLCSQGAVNTFFEQARPKAVILAAAKVGGILANNSYPADFIRDNLVIQCNVMTAAQAHGVERFIFLGSSCIYPRDCAQPMKEEYLMTGPLEATNRPYAMAKLAGVEMCWSFNRQYHAQFLAVQPTNTYGPGDNYDLQSSHVLPALIRKCHEAKMHGEASVTIWGTGTPKREFVYVDDLADACVFLLEQPEAKMAALTAEDALPVVNIGCGEDVSIAELASTVAEVVGFEGELVYDASKPDGTPRKLLDVSRINALGWQPTTALKEGIAKAYEDFVRHA